MKPTAWLLATIYCVFSICLAAAQDGPEGWFDIPDQRGALVIVITGDVKSRTFYASDYKTTLDSKFWDSTLPVTRQYRLVPGIYKIILPESLNLAMKSVDVEIREKMLSVLEISADRGVVASFKYGEKFAFDSGFNSLISSYALEGMEKYISPVELSPDENIIRLNTDPPFSIPPPPK